MTICSPDLTRPDILAPAIAHLEAPCCTGSAIRGPEHCTCWTAEFTPAPQSPDTSSTPAPMPRMCGDCAFRRNSPERRGEEYSAASWPDLLRLVETETTFWCHDGLPQLAGWRHPCGVFVPAPGDVGSYRPVVVDQVPYRADGTAGSQCAGWAAAVERQRDRDAATVTETPLAGLLARRPELRGVGLSAVLEARWTA